MDNSLSDMNDLSRMGYVLDNYDNIEVVTYKSGDLDTSGEFKSRDNTPAPMLKFSKKVNGTYYVVEAIPESKYKKFWVVSAYMKKADGGTQVPNANGPGTTPNASLASSLSASAPIVTPVDPEVNGRGGNTDAVTPGVKKQSMQNGGAVSAGSAVPFEGNGLSQRMAEAETEYNAAIAQAEFTGEYQLAAALYEEKLRVQDALTEQEIHRLRNELEQYQRQHQTGQKRTADQVTAPIAKYTEVCYHDDGTVVVTDDWTQYNHPRVPTQYHPNAVVDTLSQNGNQHDRAFFDKDGWLIRQVSNGPHGNKRRHPYGKNGEHAHDIIWKDGKIIDRPTRELTDTERKESADIL